jgi:hypothetical protein
MGRIPTSGRGSPLGLRVERPLIPVGYIELEEAINLLGQKIFPGDWTGNERGFFGTGVFGRKFRSEIELEADRAFREAVLMAQCELECELDGGDPEQQYKLRTTPQNDDEPFLPLGDLPQLSSEAMKEIEQRLSAGINRAKSVRYRREQVEYKFLREMLWSGSLGAHYVAINGKINNLEPYTWGSEDGTRDFERGWVELDKGEGLTAVRPVLIKGSELRNHLFLAPATGRQKSTASDEENTPAVPRYSRAEVRTWYKSRVEQIANSGGKSTRDEDAAAAHEHFGLSIQRSLLRDLRKELAPEMWKASGAPRQKE